MQAPERARRSIKRSVLFAAITALLLPCAMVSAEAEQQAPQASSLQASLDLSLPQAYTAPPPERVNSNINVTRNLYQGSLDGIQTHKRYALGLQRVKVDKSMRVRGWEIKDDIYFGQTRVGSKWGLGMMMTDGDFAYGLNNKGVGMTYSGENSIYRLNMQELAVEFDF